MDVHCKRILFKNTLIILVVKNVKRHSFEETAKIINIIMIYTQTYRTGPSVSNENPNYL